MEISLGDRLVFKERQELDAGSSAIRAGKNSQTPLRVNLAKNEFATVMSVSRKSDGSLDLLCQLDTPKEDGSPQVVRLNSRHLGEIDHAFATTVHRSQGMTVDSVFAVPRTFLSKELFYVMATRHRARLSIHMLESDRASILVKAGLNMDKLHGLDLVASERAGSERAGSGWTLGIWERLQKSTERLLALLQEERSRFMAVMVKSHGNAARTAVAQEGTSHSRKTAVMLGQILKIADALQGRTIGWSKSHAAQNRHHDSQTAQRVGSEQLPQHW